MTTLKNRLDRLEQQLQPQLGKPWYFYWFESGQEQPSEQQQIEINQAVAEGKNTICFRVVD